MSDSNKKYETSETDFNVFQQESLYWINKFGLTNWEIMFKHNLYDEETDRALCYIEPQSHIATLVLPFLWYSIKPSEYLIRRSAFHEVMEILLAEISILANERFASKDKIETAIHSFIRIMENIVFEGDMNRRCAKEISYMDTGCVKEGESHK